MNQDNRAQASADVVRVLRLTHVEHLREETQRTLAARSVAGSSPCAAQRLFLSERAFRDHLAAAQDLILIPMGLKRDVAYITLWFMLHRECCTAFGWMLIETSAVFPAEMT